MDPSVEYLYRGTTPGWPGHPALSEIERTPTTTDPLVATLFAVLCLNVGKGVVLLAQTEDVLERIRPANYFSALELEVGLEMKPLEFEERSCLSVSVEVAIEALAQVGFVDLPVRIAQDHMTFALEDSQRLGQRLSRTQIIEFNRLVMS